MTLRLLTSPTLAVVTLTEAKLAARVDGTEFDAIIPGLVTSAVEMAEQKCNRFFAQQTWRAELVDWPAADDVLPVHQATAAAISYWDGSSWVALASGFSFYPVELGTGVAPSSSWPTLGDVAGGPRVRIDLTAGPTSAADVPEGIKTYVKALASHWLRQPDAAGERKLEPAPFLEHLLDRWKVY